MTLRSPASVLGRKETHNGDWGPGLIYIASPLGLQLHPHTRNDHDPRHH